MFRICAFLRLTIQQKRILNLLIPVECGKLFERIYNLHRSKTELDFFMDWISLFEQGFFPWRRYRKTQNSLVNWHNNDRTSSVFNTIFESTAELVQMKINVFTENEV